MRPPLFRPLRVSAGLAAAVALGWAAGQGLGSSTAVARGGTYMCVAPHNGTPPASSATSQCISDQAAYDDCIAVGRVPVGDTSCLVWSKRLYAECILYGAYGCAQPQSYCARGPDEQTMPTDLCLSGAACPHEYTTYSTEQICIDVGGVPEPAPCLTGMECVFYSLDGPPMACTDLEVGDCIYSQPQEALCSQLGGTTAPDDTCPGSSAYSVPGALVSCICDDCQLQNEYDCAHHYCDGALSVAAPEPSCDPVGGVGCFFPTPVHVRCASPAVGGVADLPDLPAVSGDHAARVPGASRWPPANSTALAGGLASLFFLTSAGAWYAWRRWHKA